MVSPASEQDSVGPDIHLLRAQLVSNHLRRHLPNRSNKSHLHALLTKMTTTPKSGHHYCREEYYDRMRGHNHS